MADFKLGPLQVKWLKQLRMQSKRQKTGILGQNGYFTKGPKNDVAPLFPTTDPSMPECYVVCRVAGLPDDLYAGIPTK